MQQLPFRPHDFPEIRARLVGQRIGPAELAHARLSPRDKGRWGVYVEGVLGIPRNNLPTPDHEEGELKVTVCDAAGRFRESVKVCMRGQDPLKKLRSLILVI